MTTTDQPQAIDRITDLLRQNPGRWTAKEITAALDMPSGTVSSSLSNAYRDSLDHGGSGIYAFPHPDTASVAQYQWCHSRPDATTLWQYRARSPRGRRERPIVEPTLALRRSDVADDVWTDGEKFYRLTEVRVVVTVEPVASNGTEATR